MENIAEIGVIRPEDLLAAFRDLPVERDVVCIFEVGAIEHIVYGLVLCLEGLCVDANHSNELSQAKERIR